MGTLAEFKGTRAQKVEVLSKDVERSVFIVYIYVQT
jgi:hypothetical protein